MEKKSFKQILFERLEREEMTMKDLERASGIPYDRIYNLKKRPDGTTSIDTAIEIAAAFGEDLGAFMKEEYRNERQEIRDLLSQLPEEDIQQMVGFGKGLLAAQGQPRPKSGEDEQ
jgi:transcriptional regulator with XRE-family HTH domain